MLEGASSSTDSKLISRSNGIHYEPVGLIVTGFGFTGRPEHNSALAVHKRHRQWFVLRARRMCARPGWYSVLSDHSGVLRKDGVSESSLAAGSLSWVYFDAERKVNSVCSPSLAGFVLHGVGLA